MIDSYIPRPDDHIGPGDEMFAGNLEHYMSVGGSAMRMIISTLQSAGRDGIDSILDLPSGHGRVLRWLRAKFPMARITACDINRGGVDWCAKTWEARPVYSVTDIRELSLNESYDLIWCGSLLTHLGWSGWEIFLDFFSQHLTRGGILLFSTHGRRCADWLHVGRVDYGMDRETIAGLFADYSFDGFGYRDYPGQSGYGISLAAPHRVLGLLQSRPELRVIGYSEASWDAHHDIVACLRSSEVLAAQACPPLR
ncbi:MAG: class I SAM-dependent methyltransferase [Methylococcales bacterium]